MTDLLGWGGGVFACPFGLIVVHYGHTGFRQPGAKQSVVRQRVQAGTQFAHVTEHLRVLTSVGKHRGMELLRARLRLPPLEIAHRIRTHRHMRQGVTHQLPGFLAVVDRTPVDRRGGMLHQEPRVLARDTVH